MLKVTVELLTLRAEIDQPHGLNTRAFGLSSQKLRVGFSTPEHWLVVLILA